KGAGNAVQNHKRRKRRHDLHPAVASIFRPAVLKQGRRFFAPVFERHIICFYAAGLLQWYGIYLLKGGA
ncbi:MAG: hypothetical protein MRZ98_09320, partial [Clostridiales bacterium]|nr:hypothetical protein [Clostridiales bacterium]